MQKSILLSLVETMNFVDEHDGAFGEASAVFVGFGHYSSDFADAGRHRAELHKSSRSLFGDDPSESRLAGSGRTPKHERLQTILFDHLAERAPRPHDLLLADKFAEVPRSHAIRKRSVRRLIFTRQNRRFGLIEQTAIRIASHCSLSKSRHFHSLALIVRARRR